MRIFITVLIVLILAGCACPGCQGQVIDATAAQEFRQAAIELMQRQPDRMADVLFNVATGKAVPSATATVTVNTAQWNRWFNETDKGSFLSQVAWEVGNYALKQKRDISATAWGKYAAQIDIRITDPVKKQRMLDKVDYLTNPDAE